MRQGPGTADFFLSSARMEESFVFKLRWKLTFGSGQSTFPSEAEMKGMAVINIDCYPEDHNWVCMDWLLLQDGSMSKRWL